MAPSPYLRFYNFCPSRQWYQPYRLKGEICHPRRTSSAWPNWAWQPFRNDCIWEELHPNAIFRSWVWRVTYTDTYEAIKSVPIATAGTSWTSTETGETYILVFHEGLWMGDQMEHSLLNPNQLRYFEVTVQDNPFADAPLYISTENGEFVLPLEILGTNIVADTRTQTERELQECRQIVISSPHT